MNTYACRCAYIYFIWNKQFCGLLPRGLKWENKTYKLKRSFIRDDSSIWKASLSLRWWSWTEVLVSFVNYLAHCFALSFEVLEDKTNFQINQVNHEDNGKYLDTIHLQKSSWWEQSFVLPATLKGGLDSSTAFSVPLTLCLKLTLFAQENIQSKFPEEWLRMI